VNLHQLIRNILREKIAPKLSTFTTKKVSDDQKNFGLQKVGWGSSIPLYKALKSILQHMGIKITRYLGSGTFGHAFLTSDRKVLKITSDPMEVQAYQRIKNVNSNHLPKIYQIVKIKTNNDFSHYIYAVLKEFTFHNDKYKQRIEQLMSDYEELATILKQEMELHFMRKIDGNDYDKIMPSTYEDLLFVSLRGDITSESKILSIFYKLLTNENQPTLTWFIKETMGLLNDMRSLGMKEDDIKASNIGIQNKHLIYFDPRLQDQESQAERMKMEPEFTLTGPHANL